MSRRRLLLGAALAAGLTPGCGVKKDVKVTPPTGYVDVQTASRTELVELVNTRYAGIVSLTVPKFRIQLTGGTIEDGELEKYRDAGGYLIAQRQDSIYVNILNPLTKTSVLTMASAGDRFQVWIPSRNQFVTGPTDAAPAEENPIYNVRPDHILEALLVEPLPVHDPTRRVTHYEDQDAAFKYYVVMVTVAPSGELLRRLWIERSRLQLVRQQYYRNSALVSDIQYEETAEVEGQLIGLAVHVDRPREKYSVQMQLERDELALGRVLESEAFQIRRPAGAELVEVSAGSEKNERF